MLDAGCILQLVAVRALICPRCLGVCVRCSSLSLLCSSNYEVLAKERFEIEEAKATADKEVRTALGVMNLVLDCADLAASRL